MRDDIYSQHHEASDPHHWFSSNEHDPHQHASLERSRQIEAAYGQEDTEMLIALIQVRSMIWT